MNLTCDEPQKPPTFVLDQPQNKVYYKYIFYSPLLLHEGAVMEKCVFDYKQHIHYYC